MVTAPFFEAEGGALDAFFFLAELPGVMGTKELDDFDFGTGDAYGFMTVPYLVVAEVIRPSGRPVRGGVGRGGVATALRLRVSSSSSRERIGVTLGAVVRVGGAMVDTCLL